MARIPLATRDIGPYSLLPHMPEMAQKLETLRLWLRDETSLSQRLQELVMISVAREMGCAFIWYAHAAAARKAEYATTSWTAFARSARSPTSIPRSRP